ncbi:LacI family DNA-binding transcriptional regulator [Kribbella sp. NPDC056345]|uniref:LacI family DNA-binding transcriptional regulator n=1 Tax=Kribbella sp. NPDC056345 TaxID=3345789 RepID=UPI0035DC278C
MARVTQADVARAAGTSMAVVSYVVNGGPRPVAAATRQRVLAAIEQTGYRPDGVARALVGGSTMTLGLIVPDIANEFFAELARAVEHAARQVGRTVLLANSEGDAETELALLETFLQRRIDGVVIISQAPITAARLLERAGTRRVFLGAAPPDDSSIGVDNFGGAVAATMHLVGHGYERIAMIGGPADAEVAEARREGWQHALTSLGAADGAFVHQPFTVDGGYAGGLELLGGRPRPQAVFAASDRQAIGLLRAAADEGLAIPDDLAIATFDGSALSAYAVPSLTTVQQPIAQMAELAVRQLTTHDAPRLHAVLEVDLVIRRSCGCSRS